MLAIDTETTGLDLHHGCRPFFISTCDDTGKLRYWEWSVDPFTRRVEYTGSSKTFQHLIDSHDSFVFHNAKFDIRALEHLGLRLPPWSKIHDTVIAHHCLASSESHKLKDLALQHLDILDDDQDALKQATNEARKIGQKQGWRIAKPLDPYWPALKRPPKEGWWLFDTWLPRAVAKAGLAPESSDWSTVLRTYALRDAERTLALWYVLESALKQ